MKLHIANLSPKVTNQQLEQLFGKFGNVMSIELNWLQSAGRTSGTAVIEMHHAEALAAVRGLNGRAYRNRRLYITPISDQQESQMQKKQPRPEELLKKGKATS